MHRNPVYAHDTFSRRSNAECQPMDDSVRAGKCIWQFFMATTPKFFDTLIV